MMYVAVAITDETEVLGIARVALPLTQVESSMNRIIVSILLAMVVTAVLVILAAWLIARVTTRPIRELTTISKQVASGDFDHRILVGTRDESGQLAHAFNEMSFNLKELVRTISEDKTRLTTILNNMADGVIMTDLDGNIILTNKAAIRLLDLKTEDIIDRPLIEVVRDHELDDVLNLCLRNGEEQEIQFESSVLNRFIRAIVIPIINDKPSGALVLLQDLTSIRGLQTVRRELVGNISHEFRTPLAGIKAMVETLQDGGIYDNEAAKDFLDRINAEVDRLTQMVVELTELSRIETGRAELKMEPVDLNTLIEDVIRQFQPQMERQKLSFQKEFTAELPSVYADRERIRQVIGNLVHNAIKFNHPGGDIKARTRTADNSVIVEISDTGMGIAGDDLPRIFERFYKADKSRAAQGTGMGLAIAKHVVEAHGGDIWVQSEEGKGSTFGFGLSIERTS